MKEEGKCLVCLDNGDGEVLLNLHGNGNCLSHLSHWSCWMEYLRCTNQKCLPVCPLCFTHISAQIIKKTTKLTAQNRGIVSYLKCCVRLNDVKLAKAAIEEYRGDVWGADRVLKAVEERMRKEKLSIGALVNDYDPMVRALVGSMKWTMEGLESAIRCSIIADSVRLCQYLVSTFQFSNWKAALDTAAEFGSRHCQFYLGKLAGNGTLKNINCGYLEMCKQATTNNFITAKNLKAREKEMQAARKDPLMRAELREKYPELPYIVEKPSLPRRIMWAIRG